MFLHKKEATIEGSKCICVYQDGLMYKERAYFASEDDADLFINILRLFYKYDSGGEP